MGKATTLTKEVKVILAAAMEEYANDNYQKALPGLQFVARHKPETPGIHRYLAYSYIALDRYQEAIDCLSLTLEFEQISSNICLNMGFCHGQLGKLEQAEAWYKRGIDQDFDNPDLHAGYAGVLCDQGYPDLAIPEYEQALELDPKHAQSLNNLGTIYQAKGELEKAYEFYMRAVKILPEAWLLASNFLNLCAFLGKERERRQFLARLMRIDHRHPIFEPRSRLVC